MSLDFQFLQAKMPEKVNSGRRRSRLEMCLDVMDNVRVGYTKPTPLMYHSNLDWKKCRLILEFLGESRLVNLEWSKDRTKNQICRITLTKAGEDVLEKARTIQRAITQVVDFSKLVLP